MPTIQQISDHLNVACPDEPARQIIGVNAIEDAGPDELAILSSDAYVRHYKRTRAGAVLAGKKIRFTPRSEIPTLIVDDADLALVKVLQLMSWPIPQPLAGIHPSAVVDPEASIGEHTFIGANVTVGPRTRIGKNARIHPGVVISDDVVIGDDVILYPNVVIRERVTLGNRVIINAGSVIGTDGFGYRWDGKQHTKIPQIGTVVIEDDVEIGSCTCVDRARFKETRIGKGTKIDNLVQIAHNVRIGVHTIICGQVGIAGTATIGNGVVLGGATAVRDHANVGDGVTAGGHAIIVNDIDPKQVISGIPAIPHRQALREQAAIRRLPELLVQFRALQEEIEQLKARLDSAAQK